MWKTALQETGTENCAGMHAKHKPAARSGMPPPQPSNGGGVEQVVQQGVPEMLTTTRQDAQDAEDQLQLVNFQLSGEEYAIDMHRVRKIVRKLSITKVPDSPSGVEGVISLRGKVIPVMDLRKQFGLAGKRDDRHTRIVVAGVRGLIAGFVVDSVSEVLRLSSDTVQPAPPLSAGGKPEYIKGVGRIDDRPLMLLDLDRVLLDNIGALWSTIYRV